MKKVVIIGGGVSGLTAGIYAQKKGYETVIVEKHKIAGGQLTGWNRGGYHIDNCIHWLTGTNKNTADYKTWLETGMLEEGGIYQSDSLFTYEKNGKRLSLYHDIVRLQKEMISLSPKDEKRINEFIFDVKTVQRLIGIGGEKHDEGLSPFSKIKRVPRLLKYVKIRVGELAKNFDNEVIRGFLCSLTTEYFSSIALLVTFATYTGLNGALAVGGSLKAAERMTEKYLRLGGRLLTGAAVKRINTTKGVALSVTTEKGEEIFADAFIVTVDPKIVFGKMLDANMPDYLKRLYDGKKTARFSAVQCAFSCAEDKLTFKGDLIFDLNKEQSANIGSKRLVLREFTHERSFAPTGETVLQSMAILNESKSLEYIRAKNDPARYAEMKRRVSSAVKSAIIEKFPNLCDIKLLDVWTPATYKEFTGTETGSFMSFAFTGGFIPKRASGKIKGIKNVFLASQWLKAPGGLPIAATEGRMSVNYLDKYFSFQHKYYKKRKKAGAFSVKNPA